jgi:hypothetical protein
MRVRGVNAPLLGIEGSLFKTPQKHRLILPVDLIRQSVSVGIAETDVKPIDRYKCLRVFAP